MQSINSIIDILEKKIQKISNILKTLPKVVSFKLNQLILKNLNLFSISNEETSSELSNQIAIDLASYLLVNQILIYYQYSVLSEKVPKLDNTLQNLEELKHNFEKVQDNALKLIYSIDLISLFTGNSSILKQVNNIIKELKTLNLELIQEDLVGRLFQESLPRVSRKKSAAFYTRPAAAELLAQLAIDSTNEKIIDLACGTGTLLIAAYKRKLALSQNIIANSKLNKLNKIHNSTLEELFGLDIMPFAAYLAAINLKLQNLNSSNKRINIGIVNSLNLNRNSEITPLPSQNRDNFNLEIMDIVLMNPPFTRKELLTKSIKDKLPSKWSNFRSMSYWGYFILLADEVLEHNGKIAAVIPSGFFRGSDTLDLRRFIFEDKNYRFRYIIKLTKNVAFTESAIQRDFLLILEKNPTKKSSLFGLIYLTKSIDELKLGEVNIIGTKIRNVPIGEDYQNEYFKIKWMNHSEILEGIYNLWHIVGFSTPEIQNNLYDFFKMFLEKGRNLNKLIKFQDLTSIKNILRGLEPNPPGLFKTIFLVRDLDDQRISRSSLIIEKEHHDKINVRLKNSNKYFEISKKFLKIGLKTHTYCNKLAIEKPDYIIFQEFKDFQLIRKELKVPKVDFTYVNNKGLKRSAHLLIIRRFGFSEGTKLICFYSEDKLVASKNFYCVKTDVNTAKILTLWLNSSFSIIQFLLTRRETGGTWGELVKEDLMRYYIPKLNDKEINHLLKIFNNIKDLEFPSVPKQFEECFEGRKIIDRAFLEIFGFESEEIEDILRSLYSNVAVELKNLNDIKK
ncbi:MAG: class I SAM-dependent DNA methyltransferase [Candidatus Hodarchaeota archaeon]